MSGAKIAWVRHTTRRAARILFHRPAFAPGEAVHSFAHRTVHGPLRLPLDFHRDPHHPHLILLSPDKRRLKTGHEWKESARSALTEYCNTFTLLVPYQIPFVLCSPSATHVPFPFVFYLRLLTLQHQTRLALCTVPSLIFVPVSLFFQPVSSPTTCFSLIILYHSCSTKASTRT